LLIAEAANPEWVSVPLVGWSHARALAAVADVHLVTHERNRAALERAGLKPGVEFTALDSDAVMRPLWLAGRWQRRRGLGSWTTAMAMLAIGYPYFERLVWQHFGERLRAREFDLVHRITPLSPTVPSPLARRCAGAGVPFVIGPLNGGTPWPREFGRERRAEREWLSYVRGAHRWLPGYRGTREHAAAIVVGSRAAWDEILPRHRGKVIYVPENAVDPARLPASIERTDAGPLRVGFLGRLVPYKGPDLLLKALEPLLRSGAATLEIIGDGPLRATLERCAVDAGVEHAVSFAGWLPHPQALERLATVEVLGMPSFREFGGGVVLEAMAVGAVPAVLDYGGPGELVTEQTGFRVPMGTHEDVVTGFRRLFAALAANRRDLDLAARAESGRSRVSELFTWSAKARQMLEVYRFALGVRERPDFGMPFP